MLRTCSQLRLGAPAGSAGRPRGRGQRGASAAGPGDGEGRRRDGGRVQLENQRVYYEDQLQHAALQLTR